MKFDATANRIPELARWAKNGELAVLTGAGVSMLAPSSLPSWWRLNVDSYRKFAEDDAELLAFADAIEKLPLPPSVLAQFLWEILGADEYGSSLSVLRSGVPNQNHRAIASLARAGCLSAIVTLNFDQLHEQALADAGVACRVNPFAATGKPPNGAMDVWKLHGTIDRTETILATLDQTTRDQGIGTEKKAALRELRGRAHLLVLGYSGGDFFLDPDYLGFISHPCVGQLIWNVRPGEVADEGHPLLRVSRERPELTVCEGSLPELLEQLALACSAPRLVPDSGWQRDSVQERIDWQPPAGAWAGHLYSKVFRHIGSFDRELACYRWEARRAASHPGPHRSAWAIEALGVWYLAHGHRDLARSFLSALTELLDITGDDHAQVRVRQALGQLYRRYPPGTQERKDCIRQLLQLAERTGDASVLNDVGLAQYEAGEHRDAIATFEKALGVIRGETVFRATVSGNLALAQARYGDTASALSNLRRALEIEEATGNREGQIQHLRNLGRLHLELGQTASAIEPLRRASDLASGVATPYKRAETLSLLGDALVAAGHLDEAVVVYDRGAAAARESDAAHVRALLQTIIGKARLLRKQTGSA